MVRDCCAVGCYNRWEKPQEGKQRITFHKFPADATLRDAWVKAIGRPNWMPTKNSLLCSEHFRDRDFNKTYASGISKLWDGVVPSKFTHDPKKIAVKQERFEAVDTSFMKTEELPTITEEDIQSDSFNANDPNDAESVKITDNAQPTCFFLGGNGKEKDPNQKNSYLLVTVPCGKGRKDETPLSRKLRLEVTYNREIVQIKRRIIKNLHRQNRRLKERIIKIKRTINEIEKKQLQEGGFCYLET